MLIKSLISIISKMKIAILLFLVISFAVVECKNIVLAEGVMNDKLRLFVDGEELEVEWENNDSLKEIIDLTKSGSINITAHNYGSFEQVGEIGHNIISNNVQITTEPGDIVLYAGNSIVVFYGSNSWSYTKLGKIKNKTKDELKKILDKNSVTFTIMNSNTNNTNVNPQVVGDSNNYKIDFDLSTKKVKLNSGYYMPINGLGTWSLYNDTAFNSVYNALKIGVRLIDTAQYYGNEEEVGKALKKAIEDKIVKREDVFITTKVMPSNYNSAKKSIDESLSKLQVDYIDLFLIHQPGSNDEAVYRALEDGVKDGKIRSIGISNYYTKDAFDKVMSYAITTPSVIQNENHIYYQNNDLRDYVAKCGAVIESWYPFGGRGHTSESFNNEIVKNIAKKYSKTPAQIILRWHLQSNYIAIPGSSNEEHIKDNNDIYDFELTNEEIKQINDLNTNRRYENW